jgi:hypothetical protein
MVEKLRRTTSFKGIFFISAIIDVKQWGIELFEELLRSLVYKMNV